ncbi:DUF11 domain-containing protein [Candidatus Uhrbacteria bacterium]|nr:DUF11 domain-containing protein [Candidatus Uhrbacteria bacterium]
MTKKTGKRPHNSEPNFNRRRIADGSRGDAPWLDGKPEPARPTGGQQGETDRPDRTAENGGQDELESIYGNRRSPEDMNRIDRGLGIGRRRLLIGLVSFFGFLALLSWAGFFLFSPTGNRFTGDGVTVEIEGPPQVRSGDLVEYAITVRNGESVPLGTADLNLRLPSGFSVREIDPLPESGGTTVLIGSLSPGASAKIKISGIFLAPVDTRMDIQAILNYRPADFNSRFQKVSTRTVGVGDSVFELAAYGPKRALPGDPIDLEISYLNATDNTFRDLKILSSWPAGFIPEKSEPESSDQPMTEWTVAEIPANTEGRIKIRGSFASDTRGEALFTFRLGMTDGQGNFGEQERVDLGMDIMAGQLVLNLVLNGKTGDQAQKFGDPLHYSLSWQNSGDSTLDDVTVGVRFETEPESGLIDWNGLRDGREGKRTGDGLTWGKEQVKSLEHVSPGEEGTIDFTIPTADSPNSSESVDYAVTAWAEANIAAIDGKEAGRQVKTPPIRASFLSDTGLNVTARWFDGNGLPVGSGPLPPEVGQTTTYRIEWTVTNSLHDLADMRISARLPDNALWTGKSSVDAGDIRFDAAENRITWSLNWMPTDIRTLKIWFDLALTPTVDQQDRSPTLIDAAILEARDRHNGYPILLSAPPLTTALPDDDFAGGKGKVR